MALSLLFSGCTGAPKPDFTSSTALVAAGLSSAEPSSAGIPSAELPSFVAIEILDFPEKINEKPFVVKWRIHSNIPFTADQTAVYYSGESSPGYFEFVDINPEDTRYIERTKDFLYGSFVIPADFKAVVLTGNLEKIYFRVHAKVNGRNYWTEEKLIKPVLS